MLGHIAVGYSHGNASQFPASPRLSTWTKGGLAFPHVSEVQQHDPDPFIYNETVYVFYASYDGVGIGITYASCSLADYLVSPTSLVRHGSWVVAPDPSGLGDIFHTAPCVHKIAGGWRMFTHIYQSGHDRGFVCDCSDLEFPGTWHKVGITLDATGDEDMVHPESYVPPELSPSGLWKCIYATCPPAGYPWVGRLATSSTGLPGTWTKHGIVMYPTGCGGDFDRIGVHPIGRIVPLNGVLIGNTQGYDDKTWRPGFYAMIGDRFVRSPYDAVWQPSLAAGYDHGSIEAPSLLVLPNGRIDMFATTSSSFTATPGTGGGTDYQIAYGTLVP